LARSGAGLLVATMDGIDDGTLVAVPQPSDGVSHAAKLNPEDVRVDWSAPALHVDRLIRAGTPAPGPWTTHRDRRLKLGPVTLAPDADALKAGEVRLAGRAGVFVGTGSVPVRLGEVRPEGKPAMAADAWARGVRLGEDDRFL
jgi:methionyl-tRNA formyltransferase